MQRHFSRIAPHVHVEAIRDLFCAENARDILSGNPDFVLGMCCLPARYYFVLHSSTCDNNLIIFFFFLLVSIHFSLFGFLYD